MKQILHYLRDGHIEVVDAIEPILRPGHVLIRTTCSIVSPGTERMLLEFGRASILGKALQQPERVRDVLQKARTDGVAATLESVQAKLNQPIPAGYCNVGEIIAVAEDVVGFAIGDRVASNGPHAEVVRVPRTLVARIPGSVSDDQAAFTVLGAIALQGIRLLAPTLGECVVVAGLGVIGLLAVQLLKAHGNRVMGIDPDPTRRALAEKLGADAVASTEDNLLLRTREFSRGRGVDAVLICASTKSNDPIDQAAKITRKRGRIVLVGVVGMQIPRAEFYQKELSFQVSCSYGPGRYDPSYEEKGEDYPIGYVRWTEQRNFEAVLDMMADDRVDVSSIISHRFALENAAEAYKCLSDERSALGIMLEYPAPLAPFAGTPASPPMPVRVPAGVPQNRPIRIGLIGAGNYAARQLIPAFLKAGADPQLICASDGISGSLLAKRFGFSRATADPDEVFTSADVDLVLIATRHGNHSTLVTQALIAGRPVFVEKPLALKMDEIDAVVRSYTSATNPYLMVGFNRRFSPLVQNLKQAIEKSGAPPVIVITINAGQIPTGHWTQDHEMGGGRIVGEACHFIDLARYLAGNSIRKSNAIALGPVEGDRNPEDKAIITLGFSNGAIASLNYLANGHKSFAKERIEVFCDGKIWQIDNFRRLNAFGTSNPHRNTFLARQDKGQLAMAKAVISSLRENRPSPIPADELIEVAQHTIIIDRTLRGI